VSSYGNYNKIIDYLVVKVCKFPNEFNELENASSIMKSIFPTQPRSERRRFHENPCICAANLSRRWTRCSVGGKPEVCAPSDRADCREDRHGSPQTKPWQPASEMLIKRRRGVSHSNICRPADRKSRSVEQARTPVPREIRRERREGECLVGRNATARKTSRHACRHWMEQSRRRKNRARSKFFKR